MPAGFVKAPYYQVYEEEEHAHSYGRSGLTGTFEAYYGYGGYGGGGGKQEYDRGYGNQGIYEKVYPHFADCGRAQGEGDAAQGLVEWDCEGFGYSFEFFVKPCLLYTSCRTVCAGNLIRRISGSRTGNACRSLASMGREINCLHRSFCRSACINAFCVHSGKNRKYSDSNPFNTSGSRCFIFIQRFDELHRIYSSE